MQAFTPGPQQVHFSPGARADRNAAVRMGEPNVVVRGLLAGTPGVNACTYDYGIDDCGIDGDVVSEAAGQ